MPQPLFADSTFSAVWPIALPVLLGLAAVCLLLPRPKPYPTLTGAVLAGAALLAAGWGLIWRGGVAAETFLFYAFAGIAVVAGGLLITQRNPARAALSFALVVLSTCGLFLLQAAPFLMAATIIVYAGAIIVTFLFVIMLAQQDGQSDADHRSREPFLACTAGFVLLGTILYTLNLAQENKESNQLLAPVDVKKFDALLERTRQALAASSAGGIRKALETERRDFFGEFLHVAETARGAPGARELIAQLEALRKDNSLHTTADALALNVTLTELEQRAVRVRQTWDDQGRSRLPAENVAHLGRVLFTDYLLAVELGGTLLLVATIGAIAIAHRRAEAAR